MAGPPRIRLVQRFPLPSIQGLHTASYHAIAQPILAVAIAASAQYRDAVMPRLSHSPLTFLCVTRHLGSSGPINARACVLGYGGACSLVCCRCATRFRGVLCCSGGGRQTPDAILTQIFDSATLRHAYCRRLFLKFPMKALRVYVPSVCVCICVCLCVCPLI